MNCKTHTTSSTAPSPPIRRKLAKKQEAFQTTRALQSHRNIAKDLSRFVRESRWRAPHMQREPLNGRPPYLPRNIDSCRFSGGTKEKPRKIGEWGQKSRAWNEYC
jgi:hypothetical protein